MAGIDRSPPSGNSSNGQTQTLIQKRLDVIGSARGQLTPATIHHMISRLSLEVLEAIDRDTDQIRHAICNALRGLRHGHPQTPAKELLSRIWDIADGALEQSYLPQACAQIAETSMHAEVIACIRTAVIQRGYQKKFRNMAAEDFDAITVPAGETPSSAAEE